MTKVYFVLHAQPQHDWQEDRGFVMRKRSLRGINVRIKRDRIRK